MLLSCCHTRTPTAILTPELDANGKLVAVRNTSNYDELPFSDASLRMAQWIVRRNGTDVYLRNSFFRPLAEPLRFGKDGSTHNLLLLTNGDEEIIDYAKRPPFKVLVRPTDFFEVAIYIENANGERSEVSNWVLITHYTPTDCCGGDVYELLIDNQLSCWKTQTGDCYTPQ